MAREALNYISLFIMITKAKLSGSSRGNGSLGYENNYGIGATAIILVL